MGIELWGLLPHKAPRIFSRSSTTRHETSYTLTEQALLFLLQHAHGILSHQEYRPLACTNKNNSAMVKEYHSEYRAFRNFSKTVLPALLRAEIYINYFLHRNTHAEQLKEKGQSKLLQSHATLVDLRLSANARIKNNIATYERIQRASICGESTYDLKVFKAQKTAQVSLAQHPLDALSVIPTAVG